PTPMPSLTSMTAPMNPPLARADGLVAGGAPPKGGRLADLLQGDENETLIRKPPPGGWDDEPATQLRSQPWDEAQAQTTLRKVEADEPSEPSEKSAERSDGRPVTGATSASRPRPDGVRSVERSERSSSGAAMRRKTPPGPAGRAAGWVAWLLSPLALLIGVALGVLISAAAAGVVAGYGYAGQTPPSNRTPTIEVLAPMGTQVLLNGEAVGKTVLVDPDRVNKLEVTVRGHEPWSTDVKLGAGETRVFVVSPVDVKPKPAPR
ncbi:MAG: hypothetical protein ABMB14_20740, partial [Myxococcota bacterium]